MTDLATDNMLEALRGGYASHNTQVDAAKLINRLRLELAAAQEKHTKFKRDLMDMCGGW